MKTGEKPTYKELLDKVAALEREGLQTKDRYQNSERKYQKTLETIPMAAVSLDLNGHITFVNDYLLRLSGWQLPDILCKNWFKIFIPPEQRKPLEVDVFLKSIQTGTAPEQHENPIATRTGEIRDILWHNTVLKDENGQVSGVTSLGQDVTGQRRMERELSEQQHHLEKMVAERTEALEIANTALKDEIERRKLAEEEWKTSQQRLVAAIETLEDGFCLYDKDDRLVLCNGKYKEIYDTSADLITPGASFEAMLRKGVDRGQYSEAVGREEAWIQERLQAHRTANGTIEQRLGNGRWLKIAERRMPNGDIVGFRVDITRYKRAEEALQKAHEDLEKKVEERTAELKKSNDRLLVEIEARKKIETALKQQNEYLSALHDMSIGIFGRMALSELLENIVKRASKLTGIPNGFLHLYDPETDELVIHAGSGDYSGQIGYRLSADTGLAGAVWQTGKPIILEDYATWPGRLQDSLFDTSHSMIGIPLPAGCGTEGVIGLSFTDKEKKIDESLIPVLEQFAEIASLAIYNAGLFERIEEGLKKQIEIERDKREMEKKLFQSQKMESIGTLAGGIAHDFNNILSALIGYTELVMDEIEPGSRIEDHLQEVYTAGKRARDLVKQILTFARKSEEEVTAIQVNTIAKEVLKFIRSTIPSTIQIQQHIESDSLIKGNATQVHQILMNLCTNAAHAMEKDGGVLDLTTRDVLIPERIAHRDMVLKPGHYMEIRISDTGVGIHPDIIGSIFEPYFTTKDQGEGTGMGLAVVHGIVDSYGGSIVVKSEPQKGTVFSIYLPILQKHKENVPYQSQELLQGSERVLLVDDEVTIVELLEQVLERLGYRVTPCTGSLEALALFRSRPDDFDLVITDMTMPNMTGDRLAAEMMAIRKDVPIVLCTGYSKRISAERVSEIGIKALVYKPLVRADLSKTVRKVLNEAKGIPHDE